jgi:chromosome partitioning protein
MKRGSGVPGLSIITIATSKGGAGKTTVARLILGRMALAGLKAGAIDADFNHTLTDWVATAAKHPIDVRHELDEAKIVPLVVELHESHDVVVIDTAGAATQATIFAIGSADLVLVPVQTSSADIVEAIKTFNLIKSASAMLKRDVLARVVLTGVQPGTNIAEHIERELDKAKLPVMQAKLHRLVAFQEMSFTGIVPTTGVAGQQSTALLEEIATLGALPSFIGT